MRMTQIVFDGAWGGGWGRFAVHQVGVPDPGAGQVLEGAGAAGVV